MSAGKRILSLASAVILSVVCVPAALCQMSEGASRESFGRFGWLTYPWQSPPPGMISPGDISAFDGTLSFMLGEGLSIWAGAERYTLVNRGLPTRVDVLSCNWVSKTVRASFPNSPFYDITYGVITPGILIQTADNVLTISSDGLSNIAFMRDGRSIVRSGDGIVYSRLFDGKWSENWLLAWKDGASVPLLLVLRKLPVWVRLTNGRLDVSFDGPLGFAVTGNIYGIDHSSRTLAVNRSLAPEALEKCRFWSRSFISYPRACKEYFSIDEDEGRVLINDVYDYIMLPDEWGTQPYRIAPVPPLVSFAKDMGHPVEILTPSLIDYQYPTWYGPFRGADDANEVEYSLPIPPVQHRALIGQTFGDKASKMLQQINSLVANGLQFYAGGHRWADVPKPIWEHPPTGKHNIDLYTWMGALASAMSSIQFLDEPVRQGLLSAMKDRVVIPLTRYADRVPAATRVEPYTGTRYIVFFWNENGFPPNSYWDADEAAGCTLQALYYYALYSGDWDTIRTGWPLIQQIARYPEVTNDWAYLSSGCREYGMLAGYDMLSATYPGLLAFAKMARVVGDLATYQRALYLAVRATIPTIVRLKFADYARGYGLCGADQDVLGFHEHGPDCQALPPESAGGYSDQVTIRYLDSARGGTYVELVNLYLTYARQELQAWEAKLSTRYPDWYKSAFGMSDMGARAYLEEDNASLLEDLALTLPAAMTKWQADWPGVLVPQPALAVMTQRTPLWLTDSWAPSVFVASTFSEQSRAAELVFDIAGTSGLKIDGYCDPCPMSVTARSASGPARTLVRVNSPAAAETTPDSWYCPRFSVAGNGRLFMNVSGAGRTSVEVKLPSTSP